MQNNWLFKKSQGKLDDAIGDKAGKVTVKRRADDSDDDLDLEGGCGGDY
jgi:hypothetical protein